ncbi:MAG: hypothetical protein AAB922_06460, partial [Patescibacteria group bacterium]
VSWRTYNLPSDLPTGGYTLEVQDLKGQVLHRNQFVRWDGEKGLIILKTDWDGMIREQPITVGNARVIHDGAGFAVVEPYCKDVRPCNITVSSPAGLETFTILTPWWQDQVVRLASRRPVFDLPESVSVAPGKSAIIEVRNLVVGIPDYSWSFTSITPGVVLDRSSGHSDANIRVSFSSGAVPGDKAILRFDVPSSVDTPQYIEVRVAETPPRSRSR